MGPYIIQALLEIKHPAKEMGKIHKYRELSRSQGCCFQRICKRCSLLVSSVSVRFDIKNGTDILKDESNKEGL